MAAGPWKTLDLAEINPDLDTTGEQPTGRLRMRYTATYYTRSGAPTVFL